MEMINITASFLHIAALIIATLLLIKVFYFRRRRPHLNLPPGPKPWPIIGHLNLPGSLPHRFIPSLSKKYGPLMQLQFGSQPVIVASSIDMAKQILQTQDINFLDRPLTAAGKYTNYNNSDITWAPYGPYWRQARKMCIMELFTTKSLESYEYIRVEETRGLIRSIHMSEGKEINLKDHVCDVSLNVMSRIVLGSKKYLGNGEGKSKPSILNTVEFKEMLDEWSFLNGVITIGDSIPWLGFLDLDGYVKRMKKLGKKFNKFFDHVIDEHNERRRREGVKFVAKSMIDVLLQSTDDNDIDPDAKLTRPRVKAICQIEDLATDIPLTTAEIECSRTKSFETPVAIFNDPTDWWENSQMREDFLYDEADFISIPPGFDIFFPPPPGFETPKLRRKGLRLEIYRKLEELLDGSG